MQMFAFSIPDKASSLAVVLLVELRFGYCRKNNDLQMCVLYISNM